MPLQKTSGTASYDAFGGGAAAVPNYIEDMFSTYLYKGNSSTQTITNSIDLAGKGGLVWIKDRSAVVGNCLLDTNRGTGRHLLTNSTAAEIVNATSLTAYNTTGFSLGSYTGTNQSPDNYVSWTFRKQPKFFDIVTYTGTGSNTTIAHNLGSVPGTIIVKRTDTIAGWAVYHRSLANTQYLVLNTTAAAATGATWWNSTTPTSAVFSVGTDTTVNASGGTYVAYIFAHNAGGFGLTGTDNVISCGSVSYTSSSQSNINLGFEPQWILFRRSDDLSDWYITDNMRRWSAPGGDVAALVANTSAVEDPGAYVLNLNSTGFSMGVGGFTTGTYIYIAIRRGPMKVPTVGTSVYSPVLTTGTGAATNITSGFVVDTIWNKTTGTSTLVTSTEGFVTRLQSKAGLEPTSTASEVAWGNATYDVTAMGNTTVSYGIPVFTNINYASDIQINWFLQRAPGFHDVVCYTGTGVATTQTHNLGAVPELMIIKSRNNTIDWAVYNGTLGNTKYLVLNTTAAAATSGGFWNNTSPTSTTFTVGSYGNVNGAAYTYVAYLFATCPGVSKVGSYTGNGTTQTINCGFTGGARFVLIKQTDTTGDWYVYDTARGMTTLTDPYLLMNSTAAEAATLGSVTTVSTGFALNSTILAAINVSAGTYIFLAIA